MKMKVSRNYDDAQTNELFENKSRRAQFNPEFSVPDSGRASGTWEDPRSSARTRPIAGMTRSATRAPWSTVSEGYQVQLAGGPPKMR